MEVCTLHKSTLLMAFFYVQAKYFCNYSILILLLYTGVERLIMTLGRKQNSKQIYTEKIRKEIPFHRNGITQYFSSMSISGGSECKDDAIDVHPSLDVAQCYFYR